MTSSALFSTIIWLAIYAITIVLSVAQSRVDLQAASAILRRTFAILPYAIAVATPFLRPMARTIDDIERAVPFALLYVVLTAALVYAVRRQWSRSDSPKSTPP